MYDSFRIKSKASFYLDEDVLRQERRVKIRRVKAATRIQAAYRGFIVRRDIIKHFSEIETQLYKIAEKEALALRRELSARKIQRAVRQMLQLPQLARPSAKRYIHKRLTEDREPKVRVDYYDSPELEVGSFNVSRAQENELLEVETRNDCFRLMQVRRNLSVFQTSKVFDELHFSTMSFCKSMAFEDPSFHIEEKKLDSFLDLQLRVKIKSQELLDVLEERDELLSERDALRDLIARLLGRTRSQ